MIFHRMETQQQYGFITCRRTMYCKIGERIDEWAMQTMDKGLRANKLNENRKPIN